MINYIVFANEGTETRRFLVPLYYIKRTKPRGRGRAPRQGEGNSRAYDLPPVALDGNRVSPPSQSYPNRNRHGDAPRLPQGKLPSSILIRNEGDGHFIEWVPVPDHSR